MMQADIPTVAEARVKLKGILDAASQGRAVTIERAGQLFAVVEADGLRDRLARSVRYDVTVAVENGVWVGVIAGLPVAAEGADLDDLVAELIQALREYAGDWNERLRQYPNHAQHRDLVQLVHLSDDAELAEWLEGE